MVKKIGETFKQRKCISAHLFEKDDEWHLFYFDYKDAFSPLGKNHYEHGPHIHYISHLWGKIINKDNLWMMLDQRQTKIDSIHIKYINSKRK
jgi:hypothetical protein